MKFPGLLTMTGTNSPFTATCNRFGGESGILGITVIRYAVAPIDRWPGGHRHIRRNPVRGAGDNAPQIQAAEERIAQARQYIEAATRRVTPTESVNVVSDPPDNCNLECAQAVVAEFIIRGDQDLLRLGKFGVLRFWRNVPSPKLPEFVPTFEFGPRFPQPILVNTSHCGTHLVQVGSDVGAVGNRLPLCKQQQVVAFGSQLVSPWIENKT